MIRNMRMALMCLKVPVTFWVCPWQISKSRKVPVKMPVTFMPVTFPKCPWQFSKKCPWHRKNARDKSQKLNVTGIKKCHGEKKNTAEKRAESKKQQKCWVNILFLAKDVSKLKKRAEGELQKTSTEKEKLKKKACSKRKTRQAKLQDFYLTLS